jgi:hypothetical protein
VYNLSAERGFFLGYLEVEREHFVKYEVIGQTEERKIGTKVSTLVNGKLHISVVDLFMKAPLWINFGVECTNNRGYYYTHILM